MSFRFQSLLELRERERDEVGLEVGKVLEAIAQIETQIAEVDRQTDLHRHASGGDRTGTISVQGLLDHGRFTMQLIQDRQKLEAARKQLNDEYELRRQRLAVAQAEVKRFDILKDRQTQQERETAKRREQEISDEAASRVRSHRLLD